MMNQNGPGQTPHPQFRQEPNFIPRIDYTLEAHQGYVTQFAVLPNGHLASGAWDSAICIWNTNTGDYLGFLEGHTRKIQFIVALADGRLASGSQDKTLRFWEIATKHCYSVQKSSTWVSHFAMLPDGRLATGDGTKIRLWDTRTGNCMATLEGGHTDYIMDIVVLSDGRLATTSGDNWTNKICLWDLKTKKCTASIQTNAYRLVALRGNRLVSRYIDDKMSLWDANTGCSLAIMDGAGHLSTNSFILLPDGRVATGSQGTGKIRLWDTTVGRCVATLEGHAKSVDGLVALPDDRLASYSGDGTIRLWDLCSKQCFSILEHVGGGLAALPDGRLVSSGADGDYSVKIWDVGLRPVLAREAMKAPQKVAVMPPPAAHLKHAAPIHSDPFEGFAAPSSWGATTSNATTDRKSDFSAGFQPSVSDPFAEFDHLFSAPASSQATTNASSDWLSDFSAFPPAPPVAASTPSFSDLKISSSLTTIPWHALMIQRELGRGGFGVVCEALWQGARVAIKQLIGQLTPDLIEEFQRETNTHARLRHTNIIALYGVCVEPLKHALVLEFMANGSLFDVLKGPAALPWSLRLSLALDMVSGLLYLHTQHIIHRDLKSLNILVDAHMCAKIADFGLAKIKLTTATMTKSAGGTPHWMAPELFDDTVNSNATDVYAAGVVLWEIAARELPYKGKNSAQIIRYVDKGNRETIPAGTPPSFGLLISRCWAQRAADRPSIDVVARDMRQLQAPGHATPPGAGPSSAHASLDSGFAAFSRR